MASSSVQQHLASLLNRCKSMAELKQILSHISVLGLLQDSFLTSKLLLFSAVSVSGDVDFSHRLFLSLPNPSPFLWNTLIRGFSISRNPNKAFSLYNGMLLSGPRPDNLTFPFLAKASARLSSLRLGAAVHGQAAVFGLAVDSYVSNSLLHMYSSCEDISSAKKLFDEMPKRNIVSWNSLLHGYARKGDLDAAHKVFDEMPERDVVSWSGLIDGHVKAGEHRAALGLFQSMRASRVSPNSVTMVSALCACAHLGALHHGKRLHRFIEDEGMPLSLPLVTSLVDMYAKCGAVEEAVKVFGLVPRLKADILLWNAMIGGLASHGFTGRAMELFDEMKRMGVKPDEITYLGLLAACAHGGLVEKAWEFFHALESPQIEHYACMVDVLGRAGRMAEAVKLVGEMVVEPGGSVLGALLSACVSHGWVDLGTAVGKRLVEVEPEHDGRYVGLSNVYASARQWDEARSMRRAMDEQGVKKAPGFSSVEVDGAVHWFTAHDRVHPYSAEIQSLLGSMAKMMRKPVVEDFLDL